MSILRNRLLLGAAAVVSCLIFFGCSSPKGNPEDGARWYKMHNCFACHGSTGNNGKAVKIRDLDIGYRTFRSIIRDANSPIMPKFPEEKISDQDIADIYEWLKK